MTFKHILVATDFGDSAGRALSVGVELAQKFDADLTLIHSWEAPAYTYGGTYYVPVDLATPIEEAAKGLLAKDLGELKLRLPRATSLLVSGPPWREILAAATRVHADLIVVGTHGRRGLSRALLGSVAERVVRMADVPVLAVHGAGKPE